MSYNFKLELFVIVLYPSDKETDFTCKVRIIRDCTSSLMSAGKLVLGKFHLKSETPYHKFLKVEIWISSEENCQFLKCKR